MSKGIVIEELHLTVFVSRHLPQVEADVIRQTLADEIFEKRMLRAVRSVFRREASLAKAKARLSR